MPLWSGVGVVSTGPRGMSGGCSGSDPAPRRSPDPAPTRRPNSGRQDHSPRWATTTLASCTNPPVACASAWSQPRPGHRRLTGFVTPVTTTGTHTLSLAAGEVSAGLPRRQGQAASRWPPASLDSSRALRNRQLREEQGENWPAQKGSVFKPALRFSRSTINFRVIPAVTQEELWHSV